MNENGNGNGNGREGGTGGTCTLWLRLNNTRRAVAAGGTSTRRSSANVSGCSRPRPQRLSRTRFCVCWSVRTISADPSIITGNNRTERTGAIQRTQIQVRARHVDTPVSCVSVEQRMRHQRYEGDREARDAAGMVLTLISTCNIRALLRLSGKPTSRARISVSNTIPGSGSDDAGTVFLRGTLRA